MFERYTERAKAAVSAARSEALRHGSDYVRTEHLLLGLCRDPEGIAARTLENLGEDIQMLAADIERQVQPGTRAASREEITFTSRAKKVLELAVEEARRLNHNYVGTEHILLGLLREGDAVRHRI